MSEKFEKEILKRMDLLIKLSVHSNLNPNATQTESIIRLSKMGLGSRQIADTLGTTLNYVSMILSKNRRVKK